MPEIRKEILLRFTVVYLAIILFGIFVLFKVLYLQLFEGNYWKSKALELSQKNVIIPPTRGDILSIDGKVLATSVPYYEIRMDFRAEGLKKDTFYKYVDSLSIYLAQIFKDKSQKEYRSELVSAYKRGERYYLIKRKVDYQIYKKLKQLPLFRLGQNKGGFIAQQIFTRLKPYGNLAARTIGYVTKDRVVVGVEGAFDSYLRGKEGIQFMQRLSGNVWMPINNGNAIEPKDGFDVITTIDVNIQDVAHHALLTHLQKHAAAYGCVAVMETHTGEIRAIANLQYDSVSNKYIEKFNFVIGESVEPGSTFKLVSMLAALEEGCIKITDTINTGNGIVSYYGVKMKDSHEGGYGKITVSDIFAYSSNVGTSKIIKSCFDKNPKAFIERIYSLGLQDKLGLDVKGEGIPIIKDPSDTSWSGLTLPWMSIGYEVKLTPMQILTLYNAVANNGVMVKPRLIKELRYHGETYKKFDTEIINPNICSKETLHALKKMLEAVVEKGTAKNLNNTPYKIAGKTGTAQIARGKYGYRDENAQKTYRASFVGYFPADAPKFSIIVVVNSPSRSVYYGNVVAGPIFKEIADKIYATHVEIQKNFHQIAQTDTFLPDGKTGYAMDYVNICKLLKWSYSYNLSSEWVVPSCDSKKIAFKPYGINNHKKIMPNVVGMGLRDAMHVLGNLGLEVRVVGRGKVRKQSIPSGTSVDKGDMVYLELS
ncbi:MAG: transpeptidase family protein [Bacteroidales bacterium]|nr:transpeptidase family protein [Bacteroidales bacterium]